MADLRLQSGRVQAQGISSLPQPNMNFGQQRREVEFQTAAESSSVLSRTLSNLSTQMFGMAQSMAESAGEEFAANNPITEKELEAMKNGDTASFKRKFSLNAFTASVNKFRAHELSSNFELEVVNDAAKIQQQIETGFQSDGKTPYVVDAKKISEDWIAKTNGFGDVLARYSPDAAYKFRATAAVHGNRVLLAATKAASEKRFLQNQVRIEAEISLHAASLSSIINGYQGNNPAELLSLITAERERVVGNATVLGGLPAQKLALEKTAGIEADVMKATFENYVFSERTGEIGDTTAFLQRVRDKKLPPKLQNMWDIMSETQRKDVRAAMETQFASLAKTKEDQKKVQKDAAKVLANEKIMIYLEGSSTLEQKAIALNELYEISLNHPDVVSAQTLKIDLPKLLEEKVEDDPVGLAVLLEGLRANKYTTANDVLAAARTNKVSGKTAFQLSKEYLPKDSTERARVEALADIEHRLRNRSAPDGIKKGDLNGLKNALGLQKLSIADAPSTFLALLNEDEAKIEKEDNPLALAKLNDLIESGELSSSEQVYYKAQQSGFGYISPASLKGLYSKVTDRKARLDAQAVTIGKQVTEDSNAKSPTSKAVIELDATQSAKDKYDNLLKEFNDNKKNGKPYFTDSNGEKIYRPPSMNDAGNFVRKKGLDDTVKRRVEATRQSLATNWGPNGSMLSNVPEQLRATSKLSSIRATFKDDMSVDPTYIEALSRELRRLEISPTSKEGQMAIEDIIAQQRSIEKALRKSGRP